ncbi:hypothetical protein BH11ACT8_BH11ACT8_17100 [soil metagenome]
MSLAHSAADLADVAPTPTVLLARSRRLVRLRDDADRDLVVVAVEWAHSHPELDGHGAPFPGWQADPRSCHAPEATWSEVDPALHAAVSADGVTAEQAEDLHDWYGIPPVAWDAPAAFAAAIGMSTTGGKRYLRDALILRHRLRRVWEVLMAGEMPLWRARRIAERVAGLPADVVDAIDAAVAPVAARAGVVTIERLIAEQLQRLHAESREMDDEEERQTSHGVSLEVPPGIQGSGNAYLQVWGDYQDLHDFDRAVARVAEELRVRGSDDSLGARRGRAVGILADPQAASAFLDRTDLDAPEGAPKPAKQIVLYLHLSRAAVAGLDPVGRCEGLDLPLLEQQIRRWCGRTDAHLTVRPVIDLEDHHQVDAYEVPDRLREQVILLHGRCVFPYCRAKARNADCDHTTPFDPVDPAAGPTCSCNLAPLCRHHHRLKTHTAWRYVRLDATTYRWTDPHGLTYVRDRAGTRTLHDP